MISIYHENKEYENLLNNNEYKLLKSYKNDISIKNIFHFYNFYFTVYTLKHNNYYKSYVYISNREGIFIKNDKNSLDDPKNIYSEDINLLLTQIGNNMFSLHLEVLKEVLYNLNLSYNSFDFKRFNMEQE
jgi:hypothetical protein